MKNLLSVFTLCLVASVSQADVKELSPTIPAGESSSLQDMYNAQEEVKRYVEQSMERLAVTRDVMRYNYIVYKITKVADSYNQELRSYNNKVAQL
ncbi:MAG: hypothetical protein ACJA0N_001683 [Pseudohongiellaceae bacterium]|jgi:hypothetical protein